jgi:hypothetical protein
MPTAEEFHQYARESLAAAAQALTEAERQTFLQMARTWTEAALQVEAALAPAPVTPAAR